MTIIFFSDIPWYGLHQRPQHVALALSKYWKVLWVEPTTLLKKSHFKPLAVEENVYVLSVPAIPYNARLRAVKEIATTLSHVSLFRKLLGALQLRLIRRAMKRISAVNMGCGFVVQNFHLIGLAEKLRPSIVLFDYIDNAFGFTTLPPHIHDEWQKTIRTADLITVTSPGLSQQIKPYRTNGVQYVGNGVEFDHFAKVADLRRPDDLPTGKPIVGYVGAVYPWLDYELLRYVCSSRKDMNFVFIGPVHPRIAEKTSQLKQLGNVFMLGFKPYQIIPTYLHHFDVGMIPFQRNELTRTVNPVKLYEYSAAGKPTVATDFADDLQEFKKEIFIARTKEEFVAALQSALGKASDPSFVASLQKFASGHDWNLKTSQIVQLIYNHLSLRRTP